MQDRDASWEATRRASAARDSAEADRARRSSPLFLSSQAAPPIRWEARRAPPADRRRAVARPFAPGRARWAARPVWRAATRRHSHPAAAREVRRTRLEAARPKERP